MHKSRQSYEATVPDTLDLAERARLAVNALVGSYRTHEPIEPNTTMDVYRNPPILGGIQADNECWGKFLEALLEMRTASGSTQEAGLDAKSFDDMTSYLEDDNILWTTLFADWGEMKADGTQFHDIAAGGRAMLALAAKYELTGDDAVLEQLRRLVKGLRDRAIFKDDYAYYANPRIGGGLSILRDDDGNTEEPMGGRMYEKGWFDSACFVLFSFGNLAQGLCRSHILLKDKDSLDLAGRFVRFMMKERFWIPECDPEGVVSAEHAHFEGHMHATLRGLWGILEYACIVNDERLKEFVRDGYEYMRTFGIARIGLFGEGCTVGDMTCLAVKLTDAGIGDYWEDVDQYVRNHLTEIQMLSDADARVAAAGAPVKPVETWEEAEDVFARTVGMINDDAAHVNFSTVGYNYCCSYNGFSGIYYAWEGIVRCDDGAAQINLLLNRASEWLDIDSYEPYEGRAVIRNKAASSISVRIPRFTGLGDVCVTVNGNAIKTRFVGRYALIDNTEVGDVIELRYPLPENTAEYTNGWAGVTVPGWTEITRIASAAADHIPQPYALGINSRFPALGGGKYTLHFKGNTLMDVSPRDYIHPAQKMYQRDHFKRDMAPMKAVTRHITEKVIDWRIM